MKDSLKKLIVILMLCIIFIPFLLHMVAGYQALDVALKGFSDSVAKPEFTYESFWDGTFQSNYSAWSEQSLPLRGRIIRNYNTIRYQLFRLGNRPIGKNGSIFEPMYLEAELALDEYDFSKEENITKLQNMVSHMESINRKLKKFDKYFYVYIAPNKADVYPDEMPDYYVGLRNEKAVNLVDLFREEIAKTDVPYWICSDMVKDLETPAFYPTGIHWSRPYEQRATQKIVSDLAQISGKTFRNIEFTSLEKRKTPYSRDTDVYDLLNVWSYPDIDYYQYNVELTKQTQYDTLDILIEGDSFANGLREDLNAYIPEVTIYSVNRNDWVQKPDGTGYSINKNWDLFD